MAFRLPDQTVQRPQPFTTTPQPAAPLQTSQSQSQSNFRQEEDDSREWVLFSPDEEAPSTITRTDTTSTERTPRTAGLSRFSDLASLNTAAWSFTPARVASGGIDDVHTNGSLDDDNNTELDSLDDRLPAFREPVVSEPVSDRLFQSDPAILPAHDGLGTFSPSALHVQEQLWNHEQYNPQRTNEVRTRRQSSVQRHLDTVEEPQGIHMERERWQRVEQWRMEQSRALLQEIEKETKRRQRKRVGAETPRNAHQPAAIDVTRGLTAGQSSSSSRTTTGVKPSPCADNEETDTDESFWQRITRKVIKELMGIDDSLLSVILGESLAPEAEVQNDQRHDGALAKQDDGTPRSFTPNTDLSPTDIDKAMKDVVVDEPRQNEPWQERLVERIARELGILVHQLCEHPGAFTTYLRAVDSASNEYAGMPVSQPAPSLTASTPQLPSRSVSYYDTQDSQSVHSPKFIPTLQQDPATTRHAALWGIEEEEQRPFATNLSTRDGNGQLPLSESERLEREREYWERELDIKMVFRYLHSRFAGKSAPIDPNATPSPSQQQQQRQRRQESISSRAAIIRQHHPLVARAEANSRVRRSSPVLHHRIRRPSSSCASQTRLSASTKKTIGGSGSSRHYWDIGGSVSSSGAAVAVGGMGSWGDT